MKKIKDVVIKIIGFNNYRMLLVMFLRFINNFHKKTWLSVKKENYQIIEIKNKNAFFGYYDYSSVNKDKILFLTTTNDKNEKADIFYQDLNSGERKHIYSTKAWNFQMGSRLRWLSENEVIFNDFDKQKGYVSRVVNKEGKEVKKYDFPIYDISRDKEYSFYTDFTILNYYRPGYGYTNVKIPFKKYKKENKNGIFRGDFLENTTKILMSIEDIANSKSDNYEENAKIHYINHISCSPYDDVFMFFHLWKNHKNEFKNRVFIVDYEGNVIQIIDDFDRASHYCFKSKEEILLTVVKNGRCQYRLYNIRSRKYKLLDFLAVDGHPSYIDERLFITDTYPDHNGMQHILLCDENRIIAEVSQIYHNPRKNDEYRCDLHPRYSNGILTFDCISKKYRCQNIMKIDLQKIESGNSAQTYPNTSDSEKIYMRLNHSIEAIKIKVIFARIFNFSFKGHLLVNKMFKTKSRIKKEIYFNKLQRVYSMWISPQSKIEPDIRFMHFDGITIGSGVKIGKNCTLFQQVTLGKEKEKFPIIGDNVTIYAGAKVIGDVRIGDNCIIGANAVVLKDVPDNCIAVGVPARIIRR